MKYVMICDESYTSGRFFVLGALIVPVQNHPKLVAELRQWKQAKGLNPDSELKWTKVSRRYVPVYGELMRWFFGHLWAMHFTLRSLIMDTGSSFYRDFSAGKEERGFYKAYHHLLLQCLRDICIPDTTASALILLDERKDRYPFQRDVLRKTLNAAMRRDYRVERAVVNIEHRRSSGPKGEPLIQLVDVIIGAVGFVRNQFGALPGASFAKRELVQVVEEQAGAQLAYDTMPRSTFNLWTFDLRVAMLRKQARKGQRKRKRPQA